jgi:hypothetical protein
MSIPIKRVEAILSRFAIIFPIPTKARLQDVADIWNHALSNFDEKDIVFACGRLIQTITRFPFPADVIKEIEAMKKPTQTLEGKDGRTSQ